MSRVKDVLRDGGVFAFFIDWRQLPAMSIALQIAGLTWRGIAVWDKRNSRPQKADQNSKLNIFSGVQKVNSCWIEMFQCCQGYIHIQMYRVKNDFTKHRNLLNL